MKEQELLLAAIHEQVSLHPYDATWPAAYAAECRRLGAALPNAFIELQHIGSTAIPGLVAKPVIDILAGVESMAEAEALVDPICRPGYTTSAEFNATLTDRRWFMRCAHGHRTHHLHVVVHAGSVWRRYVGFRDILRARTELADQYAVLKSRWAERHRANREAYTAAKSEFVRTVLDSGSISAT